MAGGFFAGRCFASQSEATDAYYGGNPLTFSATTAHAFEKQGITWVQKNYRLEADGAMTYTGSAFAPTIVFPTCDPAEGFKDGFAVGWAIAAAVIMAAIYWRMRSAAR